MVAVLRRRATASPRRGGSAWLLDDNCIFSRRRPTDASSHPFTTSMTLSRWLADKRLLPPLPPLINCSSSVGQCAASISIETMPPLLPGLALVGVTWLLEASRNGSQWWPRSRHHARPDIHRSTDRPSQAKHAALMHTEQTDLIIIVRWSVQPKTINS